MTREEAIRHIKDIICENNSIKPRIVTFEQEKEALDMAISALEQEPCDDAISRAEVLKGAEILRDDNKTGYKAVRTKYIRELPSVAPIRGWEEMTVPCENCGHDMTFKIAVCGEPTECEDAVSREAVLSLWGLRLGDKEIYMAIHDMPSVTPKPKTGHWIAYSDGGIWIKYYECSACHRINAVKSKFCPNCGCRMDKPQESEEQTE